MSLAADEVEDGQWLVEHRAEMDRGEAAWLERLACFDRDQGWAADGQLSCVMWLVWRTYMARGTAFEKLRVAHELSRRPIVAEAFRNGRISYSAVRAISRMDNPEAEVDRAMVALAQTGEASIIDVERAVRTYRLYTDQERPLPEEPDRSRDVKILRGHDGIGQIVVTLADAEIEEYAATFQAFLDYRYRHQVDNPVDESPADDTQPVEAPIDQPRRSDQKADAFLDMVSVALAHADDGHAAGDDRYLIHLVRLAGWPAMTLLDGTPVDAATAEMICCDSAAVTHTVSQEGEPLHLGRKTREWNTAQRRAISVRDSGHCRFVGCWHTHYDVHHIQAWEDGGETDIRNGICACRRHHRMVHGGYRVEGDPNGELRFYRPDGTYIGSTWPATARTIAGTAPQ